MNRLDQIISDITYVRSCLKLLKVIQESGCCNDCHKQKYCNYKPKLGEQVRYNCPFYEEAEECIERPKSLGFDRRPEWPFGGDEP